MKYFIIVMVVMLSLVLAGCGDINKSVAGVKGYSAVCVDGVEYLQFPSGATVKYNRDGTVSLCTK